MRLWRRMQGKNYTGAPGDFAPEMQKRAPENCHRLQCKSLFNVADLVNGMWKVAPKTKVKIAFLAWSYAYKVYSASTHIISLQFNYLIVNLKIIPCHCRYVGYFIPRKERLMQMGDHQKKFTNVFLKNILEEWDDIKLGEFGTQYGPILSAKIMYDEFGKSKGFGFISYENHEAAQDVSASELGLENLAQESKARIHKGGLYSGTSL